MPRTPTPSSSTTTTTTTPPTGAASAATTATAAATANGTHAPTSSSTPATINGTPTTTTTKTKPPKSTNASTPAKTTTLTATLETAPLDVLFYGDSITWGMAHNYTGRYVQTYPRQLESRLLGKGYRVVEAALCSRTSTFDDEDNGNWMIGGDPHIFNGLAHFSPTFLGTSPRAVVILLGTNDLKVRIRAKAKQRTRLDARDVAENVARIGLLARSLHENSVRLKRHELDVVLVCPPHVKLNALSTDLGYDETSVKLSHDFPHAFAHVCEQHGFHLVVPPVDMAPSVDGVHVTPEGTKAIAEAVWAKLNALLPNVPGGEAARTKRARVAMVEAYAVPPPLPMYASLPSRVSTSAGAGVVPLPPPPTSSSSNANPTSAAATTSSTTSTHARSWAAAAASSSSSSSSAASANGVLLRNTLLNMVHPILTENLPRFASHYQALVHRVYTEMMACTSDASTIAALMKLRAALEPFPHVVRQIDARVAFHPTTRFLHGFDDESSSDAPPSSQQQSR